MSLLYTASFKEFGSLVCLWHDVKLQKMQLEVRSLSVTWRRDLWCHRVIVSFGNLSNCWLNSYGKFGGATRRRLAPPFFAICEKPEGGGADKRPPAVRGLMPIHESSPLQTTVVAIIYLWHEVMIPT